MSPEPPSIIMNTERLQALADYAILDTPPEAGFDDIVHLACQICAVPVALVSLVTEDRQWFKARVNFPACETDLNSSVCVHALAQPDRVLIIPDLTADNRTEANPLVTGEPFIRFYAGAPLVTPEGQVLGTLCAIDKVARPTGLTDAQIEGMQRLARQVVTQLDLRRAVAARDALRAEDVKTFRIREALTHMQGSINTARGDLTTVLDEVVRGAMKAIPAAQGGVVEMVEGSDLDYRAVHGSLAGQQGLRLSLHNTLSGRCATTRSPQHMRDAHVDPHVRRDLLERLKLRSAIMTPILRGQNVLGVLKLQADRSNAFSDRDLEVLGLFAGAATAGLTEGETRAAMRSQDNYWRGLFDRLSEGFVVGEVVRGVDGVVEDWRYVEVNPAWGGLLGIDPDTVVGRTVRNVIPDIEDVWVSEFAQVVDSGQPANFTRQIGILRRWYEGRAFKLNADRFGVIFLEVTDRVEAERRRAALLAIGDRLRDLTSIPEMTRAAAEIVGLTLGASRAGFGRIEGDVEEVMIEPDWTASGMASIAGRHRFEDYGDIRAHLRRGEALVIDDVTTDARTRDDPAPMLGIGIGALVNIPVREQGRTVAVFIVHDSVARRWTADELAFLRNVADRLEVGTARVRAEDQQTILNHELAHRLKNTLAMVQSIATQTLRGVSEREMVDAFNRRLLALSRAHDVLMKKSWSAARLKTVLEGVLAMQVDMDRFALVGADMNITPQAALSLSLLVHELATNALKYGALSAHEGRVSIGWRTEQGPSPKLVLDWQEEGGPMVVEPTGRGGFGSKLIRLGLLGTRDATVRYHPTGLKAEFRAPLVEIQVQFN